MTDPNAAQITQLKNDLEALTSQISTLQTTAENLYSSQAQTLQLIEELEKMGPLCSQNIDNLKEEIRNKKGGRLSKSIQLKTFQQSLTQMFERKIPHDKNFHPAITKLMKANNEICAMGPIMTYYETSCPHAIAGWKAFVSKIFANSKELDPIGKITKDPTFGKLSTQLIIPFIEHSEAIQALQLSMNSDSSSIPVDFTMMWDNVGNDFASFMQRALPFVPNPNPGPSQPRGHFATPSDALQFFNYLADFLREDKNDKTKTTWVNNPVFETGSACSWTSKIYALGKKSTEPSFPNPCTSNLPSPPPPCPLSFFHPAILKLMKANNDICALGPIITHLGSECPATMSKWYAFVSFVFQNQQEPDPIGVITSDPTYGELSTQLVIPFIEHVEALTDLEKSLKLDPFSVPTSFKTLWSKGGSDFAAQMLKNYPFVPNADPKKPRGSFATSADGLKFYFSFNLALQADTKEHTKANWATEKVFKKRDACSWISNIYVAGKNPSDPNYPDACSCTLPASPPACPNPSLPTHPHDANFYPALDMYMEASKAICPLGTVNKYYLYNCAQTYIDWNNYIQGVFENSQEKDPIGKVTSDPKYGTLSKQLILPFINLTTAATMLKNSINIDPSYPPGEFMMLWMNSGEDFNNMILSDFPFTPSLQPSGSRGTFSSTNAVTTFLINAFGYLIPDNQHLGQPNAPISWVSDPLIADDTPCHWINRFYAAGQPNKGPITPSTCNCTMTNGSTPTSCPPTPDTKYPLNPWQ